MRSKTEKEYADVNKIELEDFYRFVVKLRYAKQSVVPNNLYEFSTKNLAIRLHVITFSIVNYRLDHK